MHLLLTERQAEYLIESGKGGPQTGDTENKEKK